MTERERQQVLSDETLKVLNPKEIDFTGYNTTIKGYVVVVCKKNQYSILKEMGYEELSETEREMFNTPKYEEKFLYKISEEILLKRHPLKKK